MIEWMKEYKDEESEVGWVNGLYVQTAIGSVFSKNNKYPDKHYKIFGYDGEDLDEDAEEQYIPTDADRFFGFAIQFNKAHEKQFKTDVEDATDSNASPAVDHIES